MPFLPFLLVSVLSALTPQISTGTSFYELGTRFSADVSGKVTALRFWRWDDDPGPHVGRLWSASGAKLAEAQFVGETPSGWQEQALPMPVAVQAGAVFTVTVNSTAGAHFPILPTGLSVPLADGHLTYRAGAFSSTAGTFAALESTGNYFRDIAFEPDPQPTLTITQPATVSLNPFGEIAVDGFAPGSVVTVTVTVTDGKSTATVSGPLTIPVEPK